eukprot:564778-Prorocentrum_minimum.AAC.1
MRQLNKVVMVSSALSVSIPSSGRAGLLAGAGGRGGGFGGAGLSGGGGYGPGALEGAGGALLAADGARGGGAPEPRHHAIVHTPAKPHTAIPQPSDRNAPQPSDRSPQPPDRSLGCQVGPEATGSGSPL